MNKRIFSLGKSLLLAAVILAAPMLVSAGVTPIGVTPVTPPNVAANPLYPSGIGFNPVVDYSKPNFSQSPNIRKFIDSLPGLGAPNANNLGQYIPVAVPDVTSFPGDAGSSAANPASEYYQIQLGEYKQRMHSDLPVAGTTLRGYAQVNGPAGAPNGIKQYLGPAIIAKTYDPTKPAGLNGNGKPVRIKFINALPVNGLGNLPIPVDPTVMGAGMGPNGGNYTQNRADLHLHGGATPWISDGTPHQWVVPAGDTTTYQKGASFQNVPDMIGTAPACKGGATCFTPTATDGIGTYYYTNQQSARLMFYHDHAYGTTRLNVYDGMAAPYLLYDQFEEDIISGTNVYGGNPTNAKLLPDLGGVYHFGIPLVFQDKSFVNDATTPSAAAQTAFAAIQAAYPANGYVQTPKTLAMDPLWGYYTPPYNGTGMTGGNLWFPHEYMPVENPFDPTGNTPNGRWDYAPFMIPPMIPLNTTLPSPTLIPEGFQDTAVVNGTAFPYATLPPDALRFRMLNACNDRTLNLQLYYAKDYVTGNVCKAGFPGNTGAGFTAANCTEVSIVPAAPNSTFPTWPRDGRDGGVPDPATKGPDWIQIGNEGGLLAKVAVYPAQPIDFNYNRQIIALAGVTSRSLLMLPAFRTDVIADFSHATAGDVLIVYNDAPAAMPNFWPLNDYYTDDPDQTATGGAVTTPPGFGPNTRTMMQIRIAGSKTSSFDFSSPTIDPKTNRPALNPANPGGASFVALQAALPRIFAASQDPILVPQLAYNAAYPVGHPLHFNGATDNYVQAYQTTMNLTGAPQSVAKVKTLVGGNNYLVAPQVVIAGGGCTTTPTATALLNPMGGITLLTAGAGYTAAPAVTLGVPDVAGNVQATAVATISGGTVNAITIDEPGSGYTNILVPPVCTVAPPTGCVINTTTCVAATCSVMAPTANVVGSIRITNAGAGCTSQPQVYILTPATGGIGASAVALLNGSLVMTGKNMTEGFDVEYGRMDIRLGSTPNPLTPSVGAGFVVGIARYIDPPTELMNDGETILWRLAHLGVDSHAMHFHLFNLQVINHVDWTGVIKPPYDDEIGWKETIRTNPMEDIIVAIKPKSQVLPFTIPVSNRVLDPTTLVNSTTNFYPVPPPPGIPAVAQQSNVMTNFGWEYVWHCHLLGHEENDMMRPLVLVVASGVPLAPGTPSALAGIGNIVIGWTNNVGTTALNTPTGFRVMRRDPVTLVYSTIATINDKTVLTYTDTTVAPNTAYRYRIVAFNAMGNSPNSGFVSVTSLGWTLPTVTLAVTGTGFTSPATIPLTATAAATGSSVTKVEYYYGSTLLGSATVSPYSFSFVGANVGTYSLTAKVYSAAGASAVSTPVVVTVTAAVPLVITTTSPLTPYTLGMAFTAPTLAATGGTAPYTWAIATGSTLPAGLTLTAGALTGTPTTAGSYGFSLQVTDSHVPPVTTVKAFALVVSPAVLPVALTPTAPTGTGTATTAAFTFTGVTNATGYVIWLQDYTTATGGAISFTPAQAGCNGGTACSYTPVTPLTASHSYGWAVVAANSAGQGPWSTSLNFDTIPAAVIPAAPVALTPTGLGIATSAAFTFTGVTNATQYVIWLQDYTTATGGPIYFTPTQAGCNGGTACSYTPAVTPLTTLHSYGWAVSAANTAGQGPYSASLNFTAQ